MDVAHGSSMQKSQEALEKRDVIPLCIHTLDHSDLMTIVLHHLRIIGRHRGQLVRPGNHRCDAKVLHGFQGAFFKVDAMKCRIHATPSPHVRSCTTLSATVGAILHSWY